MSMENPLKKKDTGVICESGDQITNLCSTNGLVIGGPIFQHNDMRKITGCSPNDRVENTTSIHFINGKYAGHYLKTYRCKQWPPSSFIKSQTDTENGW